MRGTEAPGSQWCNMANPKHYCPGMVAPGNEFAYTQGERIFVIGVDRGLAADEARKLAAELTELLPSTQMSERELMERAIEQAKATGNKPLVDMLEKTWKDLFTPAPPPIQKHEYQTA